MLLLVVMVMALQCKTFDIIKSMGNMGRFLCYLFRFRRTCKNG